MSELKTAVNDVIRLYKKYYAQGDRDLLEKGSVLLAKVRELNPKVYQVLNNSTMFYIKHSQPFPMTYALIHQVIDLVCGTSLATEGVSNETNC